MLRVSTQTAAILLALLAVAMLGTGAALVYAANTAHTVERLVRDNVGDMVAAAELDIALLRQRGLVAAHILDEHNPRWLQELDGLEPAFRASIDRASAASDTPGERTLLAEAAEAFREYDAVRDKVVELCREGDSRATRTMHLNDLDRHYRLTASAFEKVLSVNREQAQGAVDQSQARLQRLVYAVATSTALTFLLGGWLGWLLYSGVFAPLRRIAERASALTGGAVAFRNGHVDALGHYLSALMTQVSEARTSAEKRRLDDAHAERLAGLGRAVTQIVHEIKNRLALLGGYASLISKRPEDTQGTRQRAQTIYREALRLEEMLSQIMVYAKPVRMVRSMQSVNVIIEALVGRLAGQLPQGTVLRTDLDPGVPDIPIDVGRVEQVLLNLFRNAADAMPTGGTITVSTRPRDGGVSMSVTDEGAGISEDMRGHLFTPFHTTKKNGNGLGLAISRQIVVDHGGSLEVVSLAGRGTTFSMCLPAGPAG